MTDTSSIETSAAQSEVAEFERIEWDRVDGASSRLTPERIALVVGLVALAAVYLYYRTWRNAYLVWYWNVGLADWLMLLSVVVLFAYGAVPMVRNGRETRRTLSRLWTRRLSVLFLAYLGAVLAIGMYANVGFSAGGLVNFTLDNFQPPVWAGGTWEYPLGTDHWGYDMIELLIAGARPIVYITVVTIGVIIPFATVVGLVAGYYGGTIDDLLMAYVDAQLSVPAIVVYLLAWMYFGGSIFLLLAAFGLLSWGGIARIVRSETLQRREEGFVLSARAIGAPSPYVLKRHVLPNVTNTVVPAAFHLLSVLVLTEAGLAFLGFPAEFQSWGMTVAEGIFNGSPTVQWWNSLFPAAALALTIVAFKVIGDDLRDVLDPRWEP